MKKGNASFPSADGFGQFKSTTGNGQVTEQPAKLPEASKDPRELAVWQKSLHQSPGRSLLILGAALFLSEFVVMFVMKFFPPLAPWIHNSLDALLMLILAFPALYGLVLRPLHQHIRDRQRAENALQEANKSLERHAAEQRFLEKQVLDIMEMERQRVGRDLHDSLGGKLTGVALMGKALAQRLATQTSADAELAEEIVGCVNESIAQTRGIARGLCPVDLSLPGLVSALRELTGETQRHSGIVCRLDAESDLQIADPFATSHLFRIAQEAVANAIRHGQPRNIAITLCAKSEQLCLEIRDDGRGLSGTGQTSKGLGLRTMMYRADLIGAGLTVNAGKDGGTTVTCLLPLARSSGKEAAGNR